MSVLIFVPRPFTLQEHVFVKSRACGCSESAGWQRASCLNLNCGFSVQPSKRRMGTSQNRLFSEVSYSCSFYVPLPGSRSSQVPGGFLISYIRSLVKCHLPEMPFQTVPFKMVQPWLAWLNGLGSSLQIRRLPVQFPVRAHGWVEGQVPSRGCVRGNHTVMFLSLSFSLLSPFL